MGIVIDSFRGENFYLSNFYEAPVTYGGITFRNNEAAFQAQKCEDPETRKEFAHLNPSEASSYPPPGQIRIIGRLRSP